MGRSVNISFKSVMQMLFILQFTYSTETGSSSLNITESFQHDKPYSSFLVRPDLSSLIKPDFSSLDEPESSLDKPYSSSLNTTERISRSGRNDDYSEFLGYSQPNMYSSSSEIKPNLEEKTYIPERIPQKLHGENVLTDTNSGRFQDTPRPTTTYLPPPAKFDDFTPLYGYTPKTAPTYYQPIRDNYYRPIPGGVSKSASNVQWSIWQTDDRGASPDDADDSKNDKRKGGAPDYVHIHHFQQPWKGDAMMMMMMKGVDAGMKGMNGMIPIPGNGDVKGSLLDKLKGDPMALIVAGLLPLSILLAAVLPSLIKMMMMNMMNGSSVPMITTTATGNNGRTSYNNTLFLHPVLEAIGQFRSKSLDGQCMQKTFCQLTKGGDKSDSRIFQKTLYKASKLVNDSWLEFLGVKTLLESFSNGDCETIPCPTFNSSSSIFLFPHSDKSKLIESPRDKSSR